MEHFGLELWHLVHDSLYVIILEFGEWGFDFWLDVHKSGLRIHFSSFSVDLGLEFEILERTFRLLETMLHLLETGFGIVKFTLNLVEFILRSNLLGFLS